MEQGPLTIEAVKQEIAMLLQMVVAEGNLDREKDLFENIVARMEKKEITPEQAKEEAHTIFNSRNQK
ncbi:MAG: hypothetical protein WCG07_02040 [Candidatus Taylorbacteria bacterium]